MIGWPAVSADEREEAKSMVLEFGVTDHSTTEKEDLHSVAPTAGAAFKSRRARRNVPQVRARFVGANLGLLRTTPRLDSYPAPALQTPPAHAATLGLPKLQSWPATVLRPRRGPPSRSPSGARVGPHLFPT